MSNSQKEKRTKEEVVRLLERAIGQEEALLDKVNKLEAELAECQNKVKNPRHEVDALALPASKVSFRLDYYRTENKGPIKCIVEHLPTRESQTFDGADTQQLNAFVAKFVQVSPHPAPKKQPSFPPVLEERKQAATAEQRSPLLKKLLPELFGAAAALPTAPLQAEPSPTKALNVPFSVLTDGESAGAIRKGQPIKIQIPMEELEVFQGRPCRMNITAVSLEKKSQQSLNTFEHCFPDGELLQVPIQSLPLDSGVYRLTVSMILRDAPKLARYEDNKLLIVQGA